MSIKLTPIAHVAALLVIAYLMVVYFPVGIALGAALTIANWRSAPRWRNAYAAITVLTTLGMTFLLPG